jgi:hypothetical protein
MTIMEAARRPLQDAQGRYEIKFVLDESAFAQALKWISSSTWLTTRYPAREVHSLYFDDLQYTAVKDNLSGVPFRKKMRLRWYGQGTAAGMSSLKLEFKIREGRLGRKEVYNLPNVEVDPMAASFADLTRITRQRMENDFADAALSDFIHPTIFLSYSRSYYEDFEGVRATLDQNINFRTTLPYENAASARAVGYPMKILEIKFAPSSKDRVSRLLRTLNLTPRRHSKYLVGLAAFGQVIYN